MPNTRLYGHSACTQEHHGKSNTGTVNPIQLHGMRRRKIWDVENMECGKEGGMEEKVNHLMGGEREREE